MSKKFYISQSKITKISGICGIMIPIVVFTFIGLAIMQSPWFEWTQHALSDLGVEGISAALFNSGMIFGGILASIFSLGLIILLSNKTGAYILLFSSLALIGIGLFPETINTLHSITSVAFFTLLTVSFLTIGLSIKQDQFERFMGSLALLFALISISSILFLIPLEGIAIPEAFACFPAFIWCMIFGLKMTNTKKIIGAASFSKLSDKVLQE